MASRIRDGVVADWAELSAVRCVEAQTKVASTGSPPNRNVVREEALARARMPESPPRGRVPRVGARW